jgi:hypothetical protein
LEANLPAIMLPVVTACLFRLPPCLCLQYLEMIEDVMANGVARGDRTGTGTLSRFGTSMRFNLRHSFPLLTSKRVFWRGACKGLWPAADPCEGCVDGRSCEGCCGLAKWHSCHRHKPHQSNTHLLPTLAPLQAWLRSCCGL